jgi:hypothetical protein
MEVWLSVNYKIFGSCLYFICDICANGNYSLTSKAMSLFENDQRFKAVDRPRDREDLFDNYIVELERKVTIRLFRGAFVFIC